MPSFFFSDGRRPPRVRRCSRCFMQQQIKNTHLGTLSFQAKKGPNSQPASQQDSKDIKSLFPEKRKSFFVNCNSWRGKGGKEWVPVYIAHSPSEWVGLREMQPFNICDVVNTLYRPLHLCYILQTPLCYMLCFLTDECGPDKLSSLSFRLNHWFKNDQEIGAFSCHIGTSWLKEVVWLELISIKILVSI